MALKLRAEKCTACGGSGKSSRGKDCVPCKSTGKLPLAKCNSCGRIQRRVQHCEKCNCPEMSLIWLGLTK